jgi:hypothetical protein
VNKGKSVVEAWGGKPRSATRYAACPLHDEEATPSCRINPKASNTSHASAILPSATRQMPTAVTSMRLPVGAMPISSPWWVPLVVQRVTTFSPEDASVEGPQSSEPSPGRPRV